MFDNIFRTFGLNSQLSKVQKTLENTGLFELGEVLDGADHLAGVAVLIVIPSNNLHLIGVLCDLLNHGLVGIEQAAVGHADDVAGDQLLGGITKGLALLSLHSGIDIFLSQILSLNNGYQDGGAASGHGHTLSRADQFAVQFGDNQADCLGSASAVGHDVGGAGTGTLQIALAMRAIQDHLVTGISMHGGHDAADDRERIVQSLGHGGQAVGGAAGGGDDGIILGQNVMVDVVHHGGQILASGGRDNNLLGASIDMGLALGLGGVEAGALQNDVDAQLLPGQILSLGLSKDRDFLAIYGDGTGNLHGLAIFFKNGLLGGDGVLVFAEHAAIALLSGVILQQLSQHSGAGQVVDTTTL